MPPTMLFKIIGGIGILLISAGILSNKKPQENIYHILGGLCLMTYSIFINDPIFIMLQGIFILVTVYDLIKNK